MLSMTGLVAALLPAAQAWRADLAAATREETRSTIGSVRQSRARNVLVVTQIALALPLLVGGGLLARTFTTLNASEPRLRRRQRPQHASRNPAIEIPERCGGRRGGRSNSAIAPPAVPGVVSAGMVNRLPLAGGTQMFDPRFRRAAAAASRSRDRRRACRHARTTSRRCAFRLSKAAISTSAIRRRRTAGRHHRRARRQADVAGRERHRQALPFLACASPRDRSRRGSKSSASSGTSSTTASTSILARRCTGPIGRRAQDRMALVVRADRNAAALTASVVAGHARRRSRPAGLRRADDG